MNWTDLENTLGPRTWTFGLNEEKTRTLGLENLDLTDMDTWTDLDEIKWTPQQNLDCTENESQTRNKTQGPDKIRCLQSLPIVACQRTYR